MNALLVLYAGQLGSEAFQPLYNGKNSLVLSLEQAQKFPGVAKTVVFGSENARMGGNSLVSALPPGTIVENRPSWTRKSLLEAIAVQQEGFDFAYFAWADCPFLDPVLTSKIADRHVRYAAEYSYADGWPYGLAPELLSAGTAAILAKILGDDDGPVERDMLFSVIQKDINEFDIETEISTVDLRCHRLNLCADSKRNLLLLRRFIQNASAPCVSKSPEDLTRRHGGTEDTEDTGREEESLPDTAMVEKIIAERPEILRTLPNFYPVQVYSGCPQSCVICPYPAIMGGELTGQKDFMDAEKFELLLEKIIDFSGDAVIDLSLWGELSLHPQKMKLIELVLQRPALALVIETSGLGWKSEELELCSGLSQKAKSNADRISPMQPLSWIVSLDTTDPQRYKELRGPGFAEAVDFANKVLELFPKDAYVQAVRTAGAEDDIEKFFRSWKENAGAENIIIQKYNDYCGFLPRRQASDISPVNRQPCWHLMRDMPVLIDGTVLLCAENLAPVHQAGAPAAQQKNGGDEKSGDDRVMGNVFSASLEDIWENGNRFYYQQCEKKYEGSCQACDEYYTYNF